MQYHLLILYFHRLKRHEIMMVLDEGQYYGVSLCEENVSIQLDIILDKSIGSYSCEHRKQLIDFLKSILHQVCEELIPASHKPKVRVPCPYCNNPHIKYDSQPGGVFCGKKRKMVPKQYYQNLLFFEGKSYTCNLPHIYSYILFIKRFQSVWRCISCWTIS